jgi:hypothetical protein
MSVFCVRWTVAAAIAPQPWLACSRCGDARPFVSSRKFRVNANGRTIDAWLIYRCSSCAATWNRPVIERRKVRDIDPRMLEALRANDPDWERRVAFDVEDLRRRAVRIQEFAEVEVRKEATAEPPPDPSRVDIRIAVPHPVSLRIDRLLAAGLGLSRQRIHRLHVGGLLAIMPERSRPLRRPVQDGMRINIGLAAGTEALAIAGAACGVARFSPGAAAD